VPNIQPNQNKAIINEITQPRLRKPLPFFAIIKNLTFFIYNLRIIGKKKFIYFCDNSADFKKAATQGANRERGDCTAIMPFLFLTTLF